MFGTLAWGWNTCSNITVRGDGAWSRIGSPAEEHECIGAYGLMISSITRNAWRVEEGRGQLECLAHAPNPPNLLRLFECEVFEQSAYHFGFGTSCN